MSKGAERRVRGGRIVLAALACLTGTLIAAGSAHAYVPTGSDFRISNVFTDGDASRVGTDSAVAYNRHANEYLVVFRADPGTNDEFEVFGRRVSATGVPQGSDFRISNVGTDGDAARDAEAPAVAFNSTANEYLVVWSGDQQANEEHEIYGQRLSSGGVPDAQGDFRVSVVGTNGDADRDAESPAVAANPEAGGYLVSWQADDPVTTPLPLPDGRQEIFGRLVSSAGVPGATEDFRYSDFGPDEDPEFDASASAVVYNTAAEAYLVVWQGEAFAAAEGVTEIWGQRVADDGDDLGGDFRISDQGLNDTDPDRDGLTPAVAYHPTLNQYMVVWQDDGAGADGEFEVFGQRLTALGADQGGDVPLSTLAGAGRSVGAPAVAFSAIAGEYLVAWAGDGLATVGEDEVFTQRVAGAGGEIGGDTRVSSVGGDGDAMRDASEPALAFGSTPNRFLATWTADDLATLGEYEIFGRLLAPAPPVTAAPPPPPQRAYELPKKKCKKKKKKKGKALATGAKKKKKKKKKC